MGVDQAGHDGARRGVNRFVGTAGFGRRLDGLGRTDFRNSVAVDEDSVIRPRRISGAVEEIAVVDEISTHVPFPFDVPDSEH